MSCQLGHHVEFDNNQLSKNNYRPHGKGVSDQGEVPG